MQLVRTAVRIRNGRQNIVRLVLVLLTDLGRAAADPLVHVRTIGGALLHWQVFNSGLPGCAMVKSLAKLYSVHWGP